jgi:hypothetical protein
VIIFGDKANGGHRCPGYFDEASRFFSFLQHFRSCMRSRGNWTGVPSLFLILEQPLCIQQTSSRPQGRLKRVLASGSSVLTDALRYPFTLVRTSERRR